jgi:hypothetical protein
MRCLAKIANSISKWGLKIVKSNKLNYYVQYITKRKKKFAVHFKRLYLNEEEGELIKLKSSGKSLSVED